MDANVKIKAETGGDASKTIGGIAKPKFVPKVPQKKSAAAAAPAESAAIKSERPQEKVRQFGPGRGGRGRGRGRGDHYDNSDGGRGGRGRGRFVMPTGQAFFTGNASALTHSKRATQAVSKGTEILQNESKLMAIMKSRGSGSASAGASAAAPGAAEDDGSDYKAFQHILMQATREVDSDTEEEGENIDALLEEGRVEEWPPVNGGYDPLAPLALPFGPRTSAAQDRVANLPLLANPADPRALEEEELNTIFLLQLPSDIKLQKKQKDATQTEGDFVSVPATAAPGASIIDEGRTGTASKSITPPGKIGKLQHMKSGRLFLVLEDGRRFEVSSGMHCSFSQYLASIEIDEKAVAAKQQAAAAAAAAPAPSSGGGGRRGGNNSYVPPVAQQVETPTGALYMMGGISRKLVITPDYPIGNKREFSNSSASASLPSDVMRAFGITATAAPAAAAPIAAAVAVTSSGHTPANNQTTTAASRTSSRTRAATGQVKLEPGTTAVRGAGRSSASAAQGGAGDGQEVVEHGMEVDFDYGAAVGGAEGEGEGDIEGQYEYFEDESGYIGDD